MAFSDRYIVHLHLIYLIIPLLSASRLSVRVLFPTTPLHFHTSEFH